MSKIIAINAGSSSLKFQLFEMPSEKVLTKGLVERIGLDNGIFTISVNDEKKTETTDIPDHSVAVKMLLDKLTKFGIIKDLNEIDGIGHRVVHGGEKFSDSVLLTDEMIHEIEEISELAPLHNPANIVGIKAFKEVLPNVPAVAVFDTAFHQTMPEQSYLYSLPYEYYEKFGIRKYGFHGTSHKYVTERAAELLGRPIEELRLISCPAAVSTSGPTRCSVHVRSHGSSSVTMWACGRRVITANGLPTLNASLNCWSNMRRRANGSSPFRATTILSSTSTKTESTTCARAVAAMPTTPNRRSCPTVVIRSITTRFLAGLIWTWLQMRPISTSPPAILWGMCSTPTALCSTAATVLLSRVRLRAKLPQRSLSAT